MRQGHMVGSNSNYNKVENEWQLKSIRAPAFVNLSNLSKHNKFWEVVEKMTRRLASLFPLPFKQKLHPKMLIEVSAAGLPWLEHFIVQCLQR